MRNLYLPKLPPRNRRETHEKAGLQERIIKHLLFRRSDNSDRPIFIETGIKMKA